MFVVRQFIAAVDRARRSIAALQTRSSFRFTSAYVCSAAIHCRVGPSAAINRRTTNKKLVPLYFSEDGSTYAACFRAVGANVDGSVYSTGW